MARFLAFAVPPPYPCNLLLGPGGSIAWALPMLAIFGVSHWHGKPFCTRPSPLPHHLAWPEAERLEVGHEAATTNMIAVARLPSGSRGRHSGEIKLVILKATRRVRAEPGRARLHPPSRLAGQGHRRWAITPCVCYEVSTFSYASRRKD